MHCFEFEGGGIGQASMNSLFFGNRIGVPLIIIFFMVFPDFIFLHSLDNFRLLKRESGNIESQKIFFMSQNVTLGGGGGGKE